MLSSEIHTTNTSLVHMDNKDIIFQVISWFANDIETYLMWGKGGRIRQDGPDDIRLSVGLWKQLDNS